MDSEAQVVTQNSALNTRSKIRQKISRDVSFSTKKIHLTQALFISFLIHTVFLYVVYNKSKKKLTGTSWQKKVYRFTLLRDTSDKDESKTPQNPQSIFENEKKNLTVKKRNQEIPPKTEAQTNSGSTSGNKHAPSTINTIDFYISYPHISRVLGEEGEVIFMLENNGNHLNIKKLKSSGFWRLDQAAEKVLTEKNSHFLKSKVKEKLTRIRFVFTLNFPS